MSMMHGKSIPRIKVIQSYNIQVEQTEGGREDHQMSDPEWVLS